MTSTKPIRKAVIPVAGLGTRMLPATKAIPKELLTIYDRPIIEYVVQEAITNGIKEIILITRNGKEAIENHFDANYELEHRLVKKGKVKTLEIVKNIIPKDVSIISIRQSDALGLGHAILCAKEIINDEPFAILLPDVLVLDNETKKLNYSFGQLINAWNETSIGQVMVERINHSLTEDYGIVDLGDQNSKPFQSIPINDMVEKPSIGRSPSNLAILGRYILPAKILDILANTKAGVGGEIQLTDALIELSRLENLNAFETNANIYDCGNKQGFLCANLEVGLRDPIIKEKLNEIFKKISS